MPQRTRQPARDGRSLHRRGDLALERARRSRGLLAEIPLRDAATNEARGVAITESSGVRYLGLRAEPLWLAVAGGPGEGTQIALREGETVVGRGSASDLQLVHPSVSRSHALFMRRDQTVHVRDLGSANGTFVEGRRVSGDVEVKPGEEVKVGSVILCVRVAGSGPVRRDAAAAKAPRSARARSPLATPSRILAVTAVLAIAAVAGIAVATHEPEVAIPSGDPAVPAALAAATPATPVPPAALDAPKLASALAPARALPHPAPRPAARARTHRRAAADSGVNPGEVEAEAVSRFKDGDAGGAIDALGLISTKHARALARQVQAFRTACASGRAAVTAHDAPGAIRSFDRALVLDRAIAGGTSRYTGDLREQLGKLHFLLGLRAYDAGDTASARTELEAALKADPTHAGAREWLARLDGGGDSGSGE